MLIERILVPMDFSACSKVALDHAALYAERFGASIDLLHVYGKQDHLPPEATAAILGQDSGTLEQLARAHAQKQLALAADEARERGVKVGSCTVEEGDAAHTILQASAKGYSLIVMGTHGRTGLAHLLIGSVAEKVLRQATCPVLTVRSPSATE